jgi:hypothetical protein
MTTAWIADEPAVIAAIERWRPITAKNTSGDVGRAALLVSGWASAEVKQHSDRMLSANTLFTVFVQSITREWTDAEWQLFAQEHAALAMWWSDQPRFDDEEIERIERSLPE